MDNKQFYNVTEVLIDIPRVDKPVDITASMYELVITESIQRTFLTGRITVIDDKKLYDDFKFSGVWTMDVKIEFSGDAMTNPPQPPIELTFYMRNIRLAQDINTESRAVVFDLIQPHGFENNNKKISKSFSGTGPEIIQNIMRQLDVEVDVSKYVRQDTPIQEEFRYIPPYISPIAAAEVVKDRLTSIKGSPFFLTTSIFGDSDSDAGNNIERVNLISFDAAMRKHPINEALPYIYSQSQTNYGDIPEAIRPFIIGSFFEENLEDTFMFTQQGGLLNEYESFDTFNGRAIDRKVFIGDHLDKMLVDGILRGNTQTVYDSDYNVEGINPKEVHSITSGRSFEDIHNIHDIKNGLDATKKIRPMQILTALERNSKKISVRGLGIMLYRMSVGESIAVRVLDTNQEKGLKDANGNEGFDVRRSGNYLILETKHIFRFTDHIVNMRIGKLDEMVEGEGPQ